MAQKNKALITIYPKARIRMLDIWSYTFETWGEQQANSYIESMEDFMNDLADKKYLWRPVPHADLGQVYFTRYEHHFIFFREFKDKSIGIMSILHESMDIPVRLFDDIEP
jgi:toxin ParE1/3/4